MSADLQAQKLASLLLDYLRATNQAALPPDLIKDLKIAASKESDSNAVVVTSAQALDPSDKKAIAAFVKSKLKEDKRIDYKLDKALIAGFTLKMGDDLVDASLRTKLVNLKDHLSFN